MPVFGQLGVADKPALILGADQLAGSHLVLAYGSGTVYLETSQ